MTYEVGQTVTHNSKEWQVDAVYDSSLKLSREGKTILVPKHAVGQIQSTQSAQIVMK